MMKPTQPLRTTTTTTTILLLVLSSYATVFAASPDPPTPEDTLHAELDFAFNLPRQVSTGQELDSFFHTANFLGGASPQPIVFSGNPSRPFEVNGETFVSLFSFFVCSLAASGPGYSRAFTMLQSTCIEY